MITVVVQRGNLEAGHVAHSLSPTIAS
jgi:hypothetical protein